MANLKANNIYLRGGIWVFSLVLVLLGINFIGKNLWNARFSIAVKGFSERKIVSDLGVWRGRFEVADPDLVTAYQRLSEQGEQVIAFLQNLGLTEKDISLEPVTTVVQYKYQDQMMTNEVEKYLLAQELTITSPDISLIQKLALESTRLIQQGIQFTSYQPQYFYTQLEALKIDMLSEAARDALSRAKALAKSNECEVRTLKSAKQGVFQITPVYSTEISDYGFNDVSSINKSIRSVVSMEYYFQCKK